jgi:hypothetical protein
VSAQSARRTSAATAGKARRQPERRQAVEEGLGQIGQDALHHGLEVGLAAEAVEHHQEREAVDWRCRGQGDQRIARAQGQLQPAFDLPAEIGTVQAWQIRRSGRQRQLQAHQKPVRHAGRALSGMAVASGFARSGADAARVASASAAPCAGRRHRRLGA